MSPAEDAILDAARDQVMAVGVRRTTLSDVARRAGVSRMTVYRRFPDVQGLVGELMTREFGATTARAVAAGAGESTGRARVVVAAVKGLELLTGHPLYARLLDVDPEIVLPYFTQRTGHFQDAAIASLAELIEAAQSDGSVRAGDPLELAATLELLLRGYAFSARSLAPARRAAVLAELGRILDAALAP